MYFLDWICINFNENSSFDLSLWLSIMYHILDFVCVHKWQDRPYTLLGFTCSCLIGHLVSWAWACRSLALIHVQMVLHKLVLMALAMILPFRISFTLLPEKVKTEIGNYQAQPE